MRNRPSPFASIEVPSVSELPPLAFREKWVKPFYNLNLWCDGDEFVARLGPVYGEIGEALTVELLSQFNWRPRITGAFFAAVKNFTGLDDLIGKLLIRSDLVYAGIGYCLALARFNTAASLHYLTAYLDYYLTEPDLWFDQGTAMAALGYLDRRNATAQRDRHMAPWTDFIANKPNWNLASDDELFQQRMASIEKASRL